MERRSILEPYLHQRLGFEGVPIDIIEPNRKNRFTYGVIFASVTHTENPNIELDHTVIQVTVDDFEKLKIEPYKRYKFTAVVKSYTKTERILGIPAVCKYYMLADINPKKFTKIEETVIKQPSIYVKSRIDSILENENNVYTKEQLIDIVKRIPNDGSVERFINNYTTSFQRVQYNMKDIESILYFSRSGINEKPI